MSVQISTTYFKVFDERYYSGIDKKSDNSDLSDYV